MHYHIRGVEVNRKLVMQGRAGCDPNKREQCCHHNQNQELRRYKMTTPEQQLVKEHKFVSSALLITQQTISSQAMPSLPKLHAKMARQGVACN